MMESEVYTDKPLEYEEVPSSESAENFQKFIYDLFEKNGVLNDLRSYLRGHIVNVLKSAQTGSIPGCQKNFTQRLELKSQALNMLIAEYLLHMEFSYSLSVFISEIPLANMSFGFAKSLLKSSEEDVTKLRFDEKDIWSVINYLGIQCDSECATNILDSYRNQDISLLFSILKSLNLHKQQSTCFDQDHSQSESQTSSLKSSDSPSERPHKHGKSRGKCYHYATCKNCQKRYIEVKQRYREKKRRFEKSNMNCNAHEEVGMEVLMRNISVLETNLIDEMFQQIKSVYGAEIDLLKSGEQERIKGAVAKHALLLKEKANELEQSYRVRETSLESNIRQKKQVLFNLAQNLRQQHKQLKEEGRRLTDKEQNLKQQLVQSEEMLKKRGEEMRSQITNELAILESHLNSMKIERDGINKERTELETMKKLNIKSIKNNEDLRNAVENLNNKASIEQSTITEVQDSKIVLNQDEKFGRLVNNLKKNININYCASNTEVQVQNARSSASSAELEIARNLRQLREENERLKVLAIQQRDEIEALSSQHSTPLRPRTAPACCSRLHPFHITVQSRLTSPSAATPSLHGAGEELSLIGTRPRVLLPSDAIPFVGNITSEGRRHLINQWRTLRRLSPPRGACKRAKSPIHNEVSKEAKEKHVSKPSEPTKAVQKEEGNYEKETEDARTEQKKSSDIPSRDRSPKTSSKTKVKSKKKSSPNQTPCKREKSPTSVLKEAKLRLRKLEIEAEAVERSYQEYRRRQDERSQGSSRGELLDTKGSRSSSKVSDRKQNDSAPTSDVKISCMSNFDRFLKNYPVRMEFTHKISKENRAKPIPNAYLEEKDNKKEKNYIETPLNEFRKLYNSQNVPRPANIENVFIPNDGCGRISERDEKTTDSDNTEVKEKAKKIEGDNKITERPVTQSKEIETGVETASRVEMIDKVKTKQAEYVILVENMNKLYNITKTSNENSNESVVKNENSNDSVEVQEDNEIGNDNLVIEVENVKEKNSVRLSNSSENLLFEIESSIANQEVEICSTKPDEDEQIEIASKKSEENVELEELYQSKENEVIGESSNKDEYDYPEDFTEMESDASLSNEIPSPISLGQTVNDDNFWA